MLLAMEVVGDARFVAQSADTLDLSNEGITSIDPNAVPAVVFRAVCAEST